MSDQISYAGHTLKELDDVLLSLSRQKDEANIRFKEEVAIVQSERGRVVRELVDMVEGRSPRQIKRQDDVRGAVPLHEVESPSGERLIIFSDGRFAVYGRDQDEEESETTAFYEMELGGKYHPSVNWIEERNEYEARAPEFDDIVTSAETPEEALREFHTLAGARLRGEVGPRILDVEPGVRLLLAAGLITKEEREAIANAQNNSRNGVPGVLVGRI